MARPKLSKKISVKEFKDYYWLKTELIAFCKQVGIVCSGGKIEIAKRIEVYLKTGIIVKNATSKSKKATSKFDWNTKPLSIDTIITDNYKNTENVRRFFTEQVGEGFKFNVLFMNWMKANAGKTLGDAIEQWNVIKVELKDKNQHKEIAPQFQYNIYIRDFMADNPNLSRKDAIKYWNIKRELPGSKKYNKEDLQLS